MDDEGEHRCGRFRKALIWSDWVLLDGLRERTARKLPLCEVCGEERPSRQPRPVDRIQIEAASAVENPLLTESARDVAGELVRRYRGKRQPLSARGLYGSLRRRRRPASAVDEQLERLMRGGWLRLCFRLRGTRRDLLTVEIRDLAGLEEAAEPGLREARRHAREEAEAALAELDHPIADQVRYALSEEPGMDPSLVEALTAVATHVATGEVLPEQVFSTRYLGDSKAFRRTKGRVRGRLGPLDRLGIREGIALTLVGGEGRLGLRDSEIDLARAGPFIGLSRDALLDLQSVTAPAAGLLLVENLAAFEACCRREVQGAEDTLVVWLAGYPGRGVRRLVEASAAAGAEARVWADLDLDGIRIARLVAKWAAVTPWRMSVADFRSALVRRSLEPRAATAIEADLIAHPEALLARTLAEILRSGHWVEQEAFLGR